MQHNFVYRQLISLLDHASFVQLLLTHPVWHRLYSQDTDSVIRVLYKRILYETNVTADYVEHLPANTPIYTTQLVKLNRLFPNINTGQTQIYHDLSNQHSCTHNICLSYRLDKMVKANKIWAALRDRIGKRSNGWRNYKFHIDPRLGYVIDSPDLDPRYGTLVADDDPNVAYFHIKNMLFVRAVMSLHMKRVRACKNNAARRSLISEVNRIQVSIDQTQSVIDQINTYLSRHHIDIERTNYSLKASFRTMPTDIKEYKSFQRGRIMSSWD
jgi:hypothetical protein